MAICQKGSSFLNYWMHLFDVVVTCAMCSKQTKYGAWLHTRNHNVFPLLFWNSGVVLVWFIMRRCWRQSQLFYIATQCCDHESDLRQDVEHTSVARPRMVLQLPIEIKTTTSYMYSTSCLFSWLDARLQCGRSWVQILARRWMSILLCLFIVSTGFPVICTPDALTLLSIQHQTLELLFGCSSIMAVHLEIWWFCWVKSCFLCSTPSLSLFIYCL